MLDRSEMGVEILQCWGQGAIEDIRLLCLPCCLDYDRPTA